MKYSVGEVMNMPATEFHLDILTAMRTGIQIPKPIESIVKGREDYMEKQQEPEFKNVVHTSLDFINRYPRSTLTNRQIVETAIVMSYGDFR